MNVMKCHILKKLAVIVFLPSVLAGCFDQDKEDEQSTMEISGSVGDGPIVNATIRAESLSGLLLGSTQSDNQANYRLSLPTPETFPVILEATGGTDIVTSNAPDFSLSSAIYDANTAIANLNPFSTIIVSIAKKIPGGLTKENLLTAGIYVSKNLFFGMDKMIVPDPISTAVIPSNVAVFVRSSETLAETLRRTSEILKTKDINYEIQDVIDNLASDLVDGILDGKSTLSVLPEVSAIFSVVSAQTLLESISNELKINGEDAGRAIDASILQIMPSAPASTTTGSVLLTDAELLHAKIALEALKSVTDNSDIELIISDLALLAAGTKISDVKTLFQNDAATILNAAMTQVIDLNSDQVIKANDVIYENIVNPTAEETEESQSFEISNISNSTYQLDTLDNGIAAYIDSSLTITTLPSQYDGLLFIRTENNDRNATGDEFFSFELSANGTVYVAFDRRIAATPNWLNDWTATDTNLVVSGGSSVFDIYKKDFVAGTVTLGGNSGAENNMYIVFAQATTVTDEMPIAKPDIASTDDATTAVISVLSNDTNLLNTPISLEVTFQPEYGSTIINAENTISYIPNGSYVGDDSFTYKITDSDGDFSVSTVSISVGCSHCANNVTLTLSWDANPVDENILSYNLYSGNASNSVTSLTKTVNVGDAGFDSTSPTYSFDASEGLQLRYSDNICFKISAINIGGESAFSGVVCSEI